MGVMFNLVVGCWVGGDDCWISFCNLLLGQGVYMVKFMVISFLEFVQQEELVKWDFNKQFFCFWGNLGIEFDCDVYENLNMLLEEDEFE